MLYLNQFNIEARDVQLLKHQHIPESKVHGANMGPIRGRQEPGGHHVGPMNFAIWDQYPYVNRFVEFTKQ